MRYQRFIILIFISLGGFFSHGKALDALPGSSRTFSEVETLASMPYALVLPSLKIHLGSGNAWVRTLNQTYQALGSEGQAMTFQEILHQTEAGALKLSAKDLRGYICAIGLVYSFGVGGGHSQDMPGGPRNIQRPQVYIEKIIGVGDSKGCGKKISSLLSITDGYAESNGGETFSEVYL